MALEETLRNYRGSIFLVSHDRYFIKNIDARIWVLENKTIKDTGMNLEQYLESRQNTKSDKPKQKTAEKPAQKATVSKNKLRSIKEDIEKIESTISQFESEKTSLEQAMSNSDFYGRGAKTVGDMDRYEMLKKEIPKLEARWEELSENLESLSH
jgi:ATPase subunit of ABC transporter with duplicated ATPase domains